MFVAKFQGYFGEQENEVPERFVFRIRVQREAEPFEQFLREVKEQARVCNFGILIDDMVWDQIVLRTNSLKLEEKMLRENKLSLESVIALCKGAETAARKNEIWSRTKEAPEADSVTANRRAACQSARLQQNASFKTLPSIRQDLSFVQQTKPVCLMLQRES